jgi:serine/threonine protein kinase
MIGTKLAHYEITSHLGSGGMGEVYQATDTKLGRPIAIKVLPEGFARDADRIARFGREARILASLNHPNIAAIYGLEESSGQNFLVMELVAGETLAARIARGRVPVDEALDTAKQIAEALEAAHEKGIVHRDLKPANIKITPEGRVKVLDFGLARALETEPSNPVLSNSPTLGVGATNAGVILGTAPYMSPEQAKGRAVDRRTDIFAFGCVLYEMLAGRRVFEGEDVADILGAVLKTDPDWSQLPSDIPASVRKLLRLCLEKNPKNRRSDAADLRIDIEEALKERDQGGAAPAVRSRTRVSSGVAAIMAIAFVSVAMLHFREKALDAPEMRLEITTPATSDPLDFTLSPDGRSLVFVASGDGPQRLWLRQLDHTDARPLPGTEEAIYPFWSPDSRSIGFFASGKLKRVDVAGGLPQVLTNVNVGRGGSWSADGTIVFGLANGALFRIAASGGDAVAVTLLKDQSSHRFPEFLPDGKRFLFYAQSAAEVQGIYLGSLDGAEPKRLTAADSAGAYLQPGYLVFFRQGALVAQRFDLNREQLTGNAETLAHVAGSAMSSATFSRGFSVSADGRIAYRAGGAGRTQLVWYDRTGKSLGPAGEYDDNTLVGPEISPDGQRVAFDRTVQNNRDVFLFDLARRNLNRFTFDPSTDGFPVWSPDGQQIAFESNRKGNYRIFAKPSSLLGREVVLHESTNNEWPLSWSRDGRFLLYHEDNLKTGYDLWALPMSGDDRKPIVVANTPYTERTGQFSPDGRFVAYDSDESGLLQIFVQPFPNPSGKWQISHTGGSYPRWRADGKELYFVAPDGHLMAASIRASETSFEHETPVPLFPTRMSLIWSKQQYAISADGRFLINQSEQESAAAPITLILNWKPPK